jgi:XTP/dITP diphosphohydrolase
MRVLLATTNKGKLREFSRLLTGLPFEVVDLGELPDVGQVEETGTTFRENANLKAREYARQTGLHTIADDSGLEVAALNGRPGVHSARYAGTDAGYEIKIPALLKEIENSKTSDRGARFVAHIAFLSPEGEVVFDAEGICNGMIADGPRGTNGFGYDPIFIPEGFDLTFGELDDEVKREISHRARAARKIMRFLRDFA